MNDSNLKHADHFSGQHDLTIKEIMMDLDDKDLFNYCRVNKAAERLCNDEGFWKERSIIHDIKDKIPGVSAKVNYQIMSTINILALDALSSRNMKPYIEYIYSLVRDRKLSKDNDLLIEYITDYAELHNVDRDHVKNLFALCLIKDGKEIGFDMTDENSWVHFLQYVDVTVAYNIGQRVRAKHEKLLEEGGDTRFTDPFDVLVDGDAPYVFKDNVIIAYAEGAGINRLKMSIYFIDFGRFKLTKHFYDKLDNSVSVKDFYRHWNKLHDRNLNKYTGFINFLIYAKIHFTYDDFITDSSEGNTILLIDETMYMMEAYDVIPTEKFIKFYRNKPNSYDLQHIRERNL